MPDPYATPVRCSERLASIRGRGATARRGPNPQLTAFAINYLLTARDREI